MEIFFKNVLVTFPFPSLPPSSRLFASMEIETFSNNSKKRKFEFKRYSWKPKVL